MTTETSLYGQSLYDLAAEEGLSEEILDEMGAVEKIFKENPDYPYQMAIRSDLARSVVYDSVDLTKPFVESDFDRMTDCIHLFMGRKAAFVALQRVLQHHHVRVLDKQLIGLQN